MKYLLLLSFLLLPWKNHAQVIADPAFEQIAITDNAGGAANQQALPLGGIFTLQVPIRNLSPTAALPAGSCKIKIGLGSKLVLDPDFDLSTTNTSEFFDWTALPQGGQVLLTGDLKINLPPGYNVVLLLRVKGQVLGSSTITSNFLITNHNTAINLSDDNPTNNISFLPYTIVQPVPVNFTYLQAMQQGCGILVQFGAANEINVARYEIEAGKSSQQLSPVGQLSASQALRYQYNLTLTPALQAPLLYIRVKSVDWDGRVQYTPAVTVKALCNGAGGMLQLYPNPLPPQQSNLTIRPLAGLLNGPVQLTLLDAAGRVLRRSVATLVNVPQWVLPTDGLPAGQYLLRWQDKNGTTALPFQKI
jgi:hypothetical protein